MKDLFPKLQTIPMLKEIEQKWIALGYCPKCAIPMRAIPSHTDLFEGFQCTKCKLVVLR